MVATPEPGSADLAWAEPVAETGESITDPAPDPAPFLEPQPVEPSRPEPATDTATTVAAVDPEDLRAALEKLAWEAFGSLSEELVNETVRRVEAIAWEVLPQLAEKLIREEIEKLKSGGDS